jgi:hypothetical protein
MFRRISGLYSECIRGILNTLRWTNYEQRCLNKAWETLSQSGCVGIDGHWTGYYHCRPLYFEADLCIFSLLLAALPQYTFKMLQRCGVVMECKHGRVPNPRYLFPASHCTYCLCLNNVHSMRKQGLMNAGIKWICRRLPDQGTKLVRYSEYSLIYIISSYVLVLKLSYWCMRRQWVGVREYQWARRRREGRKIFPGSQRQTDTAWRHEALLSVRTNVHRRFTVHQTQNGRFISSYPDTYRRFSRPIIIMTPPSTCHINLAQKCW